MASAATSSADQEEISIMDLDEPPSSQQINDYGSFQCALGESVDEQVGNGGENVDVETLQKSIPLLFNSFQATLSKNDQTIFKQLKICDQAGLNLETMPLFGPKSFDLLNNSSKKFANNTNPNPLFIHSTRANLILTSCIDDKKAYYTALHYNENLSYPDNPEIYNLEFLLPLLCHILNEKNICDGVKVISNGWIYFIVQGLSLENEQLRKLACLAYQRLLLNFQQTKIYRNHDVKIWLHFLNAVRRGIQAAGQARLSHLLATWIVAIWKVLKEPKDPMYPFVTHCLFARPILEMSYLPDFIPFYNATDNKESRTWLLTVLFYGLRTLEDWKIIQRSPLIRLLCSSFILEKVSTQRTIVAILTHGSKISEVVEEMIEKYSLLLWLANVKVTNRSLKTELEDFFYKLRDLSIKNCQKKAASPKNKNDRSRNCSLVLRNVLFELVAKKQGWTNDSSKSVTSVTEGSSFVLEENNELEQENKIQ